MNILIDSEDIFFITGVINLINESWFSPRPDNHPVFLIADEKRSLLAPDIVISDIKIVKNPGRKVTICHKKLSCHVLLKLASKCSKKEGSICHEHHLYLEKNQSAKELQQLFRNGSSPIFSSHTPGKNRCDKTSCITLSRQQTMVVQYIRDGLSLTDISRRTSLSVKTISTHKRAIMRKLGMKNNSEFYQYTLSGSV
ncbi:response regulator transcription factor [Erwinia mallotivora]|uniref:response regulator transcription factor n=1 Tax=Erwinia mallotivora TaxID=69222 RepID=UPI0021BE5073|nr:LuxR C-terminal-related transcriptional regulator [Erwinia mallotivora]